MTDGERRYSNQQSSTKRRPLSLLNDPDATAISRAKGLAHFETLFTNAVPEPLDFKANLYGVFVQGSYRFGAF